jgi:hypothetical protein
MAKPIECVRIILGKVDPARVNRVFVATRGNSSAVGPPTNHSWLFFLEVLQQLTPEEREILLSRCLGDTDARVLTMLLDATLPS